MTQRLNFGIVLSLLSTSLLTGCVSLKLAPSATQYTRVPAATRQAQLAKIQAWDIAGAFSFKSQGKLNLANYTWQQTAANQYVINIDSALHVYRVTVEGTPQRVKLIESQQKVMSAATPEALLEQRLHTHLPIRSLQYWIRGMPAPGPFRADYDTYGHIQTLSQAGWRIAFDHYTHVKAVDLPQRLSIQGPSQQIKLVIKSWSI